MNQTTTTKAGERTQQTTEARKKMEVLQKLVGEIKPLLPEGWNAAQGMDAFSPDEFVMVDCFHPNPQAPIKERREHREKYRAASDEVLGILRDNLTGVTLSRDGATIYVRVAGTPKVKRIADAKAKCHWLASEAAGSSDSISVSWIMDGARFHVWLKGTEIEKGILYKNPPLNVDKYRNPEAYFRTRKLDATSKENAKAIAEVLALVDIEQAKEDYLAKTRREREANAAAQAKRDFEKKVADNAKEITEAMRGVIALARDPAGSSFTLREFLDQIEGMVLIEALAKIDA